MSSATARRERKVVTVLFADLVGFTARAEELDPEDVEAILRPYHERLRAELERFGGTVEKFIGDAVMALFGAPIAHEDDPERAVRAALAIRDWAREEEGAQVRIAVNTGEALINLAARPESGQGMAAGDVVNTTARLQGAAPVNGLLVGEATYRATRHAIDYREAEPVEAKGKAEPVAVWEAVDARARVARESVSTRAKLVGRERELALLREMLVRVRDDLAPQLVTLVGVPGIGKSRLVYELMQIVEQGGVLTYWRQGRALPYGEGVTFWALREIVKAQAGILETDDEEEARRKLSEAVANVISDSTDAEWVEKHLRPLAGLEAEPQTGRDRRGEAFAGWRRLLEAMAEQRPLVLVFEDLHWADDGLLDFIDHLVDWATGVPILIVCTARPELLERRPGWGGGKLNTTTLSLPPLSEEETARLLGALFEQPLLDASLQHALLLRAGGNPLYAEQYAAMALEKGETENLPVPETLQGVIAARLDRLPPEEKELLQDAAVLGKVFWLGGLIDGRSRSDVEQRLHALGRKGFVQRARRTSVGDEAEYAFLHLLVRDVAYGQIPRGDRAQKHYRAAEWIESLGRRDDHAEMLAYHYASSLELARAAGRDTGAVEQRARIALRDAGERARALNAYLAAEHFYEKALALWPPEETETRADLLFRRSLAAYSGGRDGRADAIEEARAALIAAGDPDRAAETEALLAADAWMRGRRGSGLEHLRRAEALLTERASSAAKARVLGEVARYHMLGGHDDAAIASGREALDRDRARARRRPSRRSRHCRDGSRKRRRHRRRRRGPRARTRDRGTRRLALGTMACVQQPRRLFLAGLR
jgi:class 3 adenylate cyclase